MGYVTWTEFGLIVIFVGGIILVAYLIILVRNLNESVKSLKNLIQTNKDGINSTLKDIPIISANLVEITETAKSEMKAAQNAMQSLSDTAEMAAATAETIKNDIVGKAKSVLELIDLAKRVFFAGNKKNDPV